MSVSECVCVVSLLDATSWPEEPRDCIAVTATWLPSRLGPDEHGKVGFYVRINVPTFAIVSPEPHHRSGHATRPPRPSSCLLTAALPM